MQQRELGRSGLKNNTIKMPRRGFIGGVDLAAMTVALPGVAATGRASASPATARPSAC